MRAPDRAILAIMGRGGRVITERVDFGTAELVPDPDRGGAWTLLLDGAAQSYVDLTDATNLDFEYVRRIGSLVDALAPAGAPLRVLHLGGGGLSLPRYVLATRPGSMQRVVERDAALIALVRRVLPLPRHAGIHIRAADARDAVQASGPGRYDLVVGDVYGGSRVPARLGTVEFAAAVARVMRRRGCYAVNLADGAPLAYARAQVATLSAVFAEVCLIAEPGVLRGRRFGNVVLVAALAPGVLPVDALRRAATRDAFRCRVVHGEALRAFAGGARPVCDRLAVESPSPPAGLFGHR
jgi:spermidine synthase